MTQYSKLLFITALAWSGCANSEEPPKPDVVVAVRTAQATVQDVEEMVNAPATVFPIAEARVAPKSTAPIARLAVRKGDRVSRGQPLAWLRSEDLDAQLAEAKAQVTDAEATLEKVSAGTLPTEIERSTGEVERTDAALAEAKQIFERRQTLVSEGALPERDLLLAKTQYEQAQTANRVAKSALDLLSNQSHLQDIRIAESRLEQARARLKLVEAQLGYTRIDSPSNGVVTEQFLYPGDMAVARGQFPEEGIAGLAAGQTCRFSAVDAPDSLRVGKLTVINQAVDGLRRTVEAWCEIPNSDASIKAGAYGDLTVVIGVHPQAVTVPLAAVQFEPDRDYGVVWTVVSDGRATRLQVKVGAVAGDVAEIESGLRGNETVVVEGGYGLSEGMTVHRAESSP
jgi:multidrug efflux pump subunit AcrA (membrane-fusion protein)